VQRGGVFIEQQHGRLHHSNHDHGQGLPLTAGQQHHLVVQTPFQAQPHLLELFAKNRPIALLYCIKYRGIILSVCIKVSIMYFFIST
jgi:hypothetical protein